MHSLFSLALPAVLGVLSLAPQNVAAYPPHAATALVATDDAPSYSKPTDMIPTPIEYGLGDEILVWCSAADLWGETTTVWYLMDPSPFFMRDVDLDLLGGTTMEKESEIFQGLSEDTVSVV
ncbi:hypothetical protein FQN54_007016 [Arachnomyces sp. PD_36]|nr:hypothetical protein FQN54_007016 [Arachnomyces sp. PD_36]